MSIYSTYDLTDLVRDDGIKTFSAHEIATGRPVQIHLFTRPQSIEMQALLKKVAELATGCATRYFRRGRGYCSGIACRDFPVPFLASPIVWSGCNGPGDIHSRSNRIELCCGAGLLPSGAPCDANRSDSRAALRVIANGCVTFSAHENCFLRRRALHLGALRGRGRQACRRSLRC
jgi:hypothetical protein